jgi:hypothetical protein
MNQPIRLTDQEGRVLSMDAFQRRYLAAEAQADRMRVLRGCRNGLVLSGLLAVAAGVVWRRVWG